MARRTAGELEDIKSKVEFTYSHWGNLLRVDTSKKYQEDPSALGYCYKSFTDRIVNYCVVCHQTGDPEADKLIMMHEYGHIYLGHLDGIHEELDGQVLWTIQNQREALIEHINKECGIDFADKLLERVLDDPGMNHSLHNIAMDMEVNTRVLSPEDIGVMEMGISKAIPDVKEQILKDELQKKLKDGNLSEEEKKEAEDILKQIESEAKIKLILPERYHFPDGSPFPNERTYPEYLIMIIQHLDQFVKMLVNIVMQGGNGDTSGVSQQDIQDALNGQGMQGLSDLMDAAGMSPGSNKQPPKDGGDPIDCPYDGKGQSKDHATPERDQADQDRKEGKVQPHSGTPGCSTTGGAGGQRVVNQNADPIDMAIDEVMRGFKNKVIERKTTRLTMRKYNRGINRVVISPSYKDRDVVSFDPTIVFLIDVSGSMDTYLIDRILKSISLKMKKIQKGLKYNIITCSTRVEDHLQNIDPKKPVPKISSGGGTRLVEGFKFFKQHYDKNAILILISDFEDSLGEWHNIEKTMNGYTMYGFNYGYRNYNQEWTNFKVKDFTSRNGY